MPRKKQEVDENLMHRERPENGLDNVNLPDGNGAEFLVQLSAPVRIAASIQGTADMLFHKWNAEYVDEKSNAKKNSDIKKKDDPEMFISRNETGYICLPAEYVRMSIIGAAKYVADPRSPRKSMMDLAKAAFIMNEKLLSLGTKKWDLLDKRRVQIQKSGINRTRPCFLEGWKVSFTATILLAEYIPPKLFHQLLTMAGAYIGVADFRPSFGRFAVTHFEVLK